MAKKKKHKSKKNKHNNKVVKKTTINTNESDLKTASDAENLPSEKNKTKNYVLKDVKYSLILLGAIIVCFIGIYLLMMNKTVSDYFYGLIKINL